MIPDDHLCTRVSVPVFTTAPSPPPVSHTYFARARTGCTGQDTMGLDPALVVVIEDSHIGLTAAKAAGMNCLVRSGEKAPPPPRPL